MDRYSHVGVFDTAGALEKLPPLPGKLESPDAAQRKATGTEGKRISDSVATHLPLTGDGEGRIVSDGGGMAPDQGDDGKSFAGRELSLAGGSSRAEAPGGFEPPVEVLLDLWCLC
jgi:hypothetical protein